VTKRQNTPEQKVLAYIKAKKLLGRGEKVLAAVSGGPDSVCLLYILNNLSKTLGITLHIAHLNHQLRGADADADAAYVNTLAKRLKIPVTVASRDVNAYRKKHRLTLEEAAREVRYDFLAETADKVGAAKIAVGHTAGDNAETVLMHVIRGSGTRGLRGILPTSQRTTSGHKITIIRPLLELTREETVNYCLENRLKPRTDAGNASLEPLRNKVRLSLLPELRRYNPQIEAALKRLSANASGDMEYIEGEAEKIRDKIVKQEKDTAAIVKKVFLTLPPALQRQVLRGCIAGLLGNLKDIEAEHIEDIIQALKKPAGKIIGLPFGLNFTIEYDRFMLAKDGAEDCPYPPLAGRVALVVPGETDFSGWRVMAVFVTPSGMKESNTDGFTACFDAAKAGKELAVRCRQPGDRFQPLGMKQFKKLNVFMIDAKIPRGWRDKVPLVCAGNEIIWAAGWRTDERYKVTPAAKKVLMLEFRRR
jgi:tRNA(Ile)-lysidine synthase